MSLFQDQHITVCLSAYNAEKYIGNSITNILAQTYSNFSLYVVNDASTDKTKEAVLPYLRDKRVTLLDMKQNIGTYAAKNYVLKNYAAGEFWAHQDADDWSEPGRFEKELNYILEHNLDGCGTAVDEIYCDNIEPRIPSEHPLVYNEKDNCSHRLNFYPESVTKETISVNIEDLPKLKIAKNGSLLMKLDTMRQLGGFDGRTHTGADSDLLWRFVLVYKFGNIQEMLYHRRFHKDSLTQDPVTGWNSEKRKLYATKALAKHEERLHVAVAGDITALKKMVQEDMYYPDVSVEIIRGT